MTESAQPAVTHDAPHSVAVGDTHASTEAAHGGGGGGLPQFEFQHWFGQIVYLLFLFAILYWLMAKVFVPRLRGVIDQRAATIADAVQTARQVQAEAAGQAEAAKAEVEAANALAAEEEAVVNARIAEAETAIGKTRDAAMTNVATIAADTAAAIVERLTGKAPSAAEADAAVKGAA
jgi:F-type H+-transporting ATPase subunit b